MIVWDVYNEKVIDTPWCGTLTANCGCPTGCGCFFVAEGKMDEEKNLKRLSKWRIRKLTPRECGRLMAVSDSDIDKMEAVNSNSQLFKQFGNSIVVDVLKALFLQMNIQGIRSWNDGNRAA